MMISKVMGKSFWAALFIFFTMSGTVFAEDTVKTINPVDPYEPFNRVVYRFNNIADRVVLKPVATLYNKIMPRPLVKGISNIFSNIDTVPTVANDVLQGNLYQATSDA